MSKVFRKMNSLFFFFDKLQVSTNLIMDITVEEETVESGSVEERTGNGAVEVVTM